MDFFDNIDENVEWDSTNKKKKNKIEQDTAKINAAPVDNQLQQTPELNLEQPKLSDNAESNQNEQNEQAINSANVNTSNIGDNLFSKINTKPSLVDSETPSETPIEPNNVENKEINKPIDNRSDEQIIEDYVENNPEEAKVVLPENSDLKKEAEQVNDGDKRTDEVANEAVDKFIEDEPKLANEIVEEAADDNSVLNDNDKSIVVDNDDVEEYEGEVFDPNEIESKIDEPIDNNIEQPIEDQLDEKEQEIENLYQQGKEKLINTKPTDKWDIDRIESFRNDLNSAVESIDPNDPESIHKLAKLERKRRQLLRAIKTKKEIEAKELSEVDNNVIDLAEQELVESAIDPAEAIYSLKQDEQREADERMASYIKEANEATRKRLAEYEADPEETKKLNDPNKQLAIYSDKAIMELEKTEEVIKEKEEKIRKRFGLPRIRPVITNPVAPTNSGFTPNLKKEPIERFSNKSRPSISPNRFPTGPGSAAINRGADMPKAQHDLDIKANGAVKSIGPKPLTEQIEQPATSSKGNSYDAKQNVNSANAPRPGSLVGWASVNNKGGGRFAANKGKAPKFSSGSSSNNTNSKLAAKKQADARNITKKEVAQKILSESRQWQINERGEKDSGADLLPVRLYVKDDKIEVSIIGTGRKRKSLDSVNDQELALIDKQI